jgi:hypothetical protein
LKLREALHIFSRKLATLHPTKCAGFIFGTMMVRGPGGCVSVDQLESNTPGVVAQLKGISTKIRCTCATVFVDHFLRLGYIHMQHKLTSNETLEATYDVEAFATYQGVPIKHYHADNRRFEDNTFVK